MVGGSVGKCSVVGWSVVGGFNKTHSLKREPDKFQKKTPVFRYFPTNSTKLSISLFLKSPSV